MWLSFPRNVCLAKTPVCCYSSTLWDWPCDTTRRLYVIVMEPVLVMLEAVSWRTVSSTSDCYMSYHWMCPMPVCFLTTLYARVNTKYFKALTVQCYVNIYCKYLWINTLCVGFCDCVVDNLLYSSTTGIFIVPWFQFVVIRSALYSKPNIYSLNSTMSQKNLISLFIKIINPTPP